MLGHLLSWLFRSQHRGGSRKRTTRNDYHIDAAAIAMDDPSLAWAVVEPVWMLSKGSSWSKRLPAVWDAVPQELLYVYAVTWVEREVNNGGFWQYFYNSTADWPARALAGIEAIELAEYGELLTQAISAWPGGNLPRSRFGRRRILPEDPYGEVNDQQRAMLDAWDALDSRFFDLYGDGWEFYAKIAGYVRKHPGQFFK